MELVPAVTAWLSSKQRLLKRNVQDAVSNPADFVDKQLTNFNEDMKPEQVFDLEVWKRELASQGKGLVEGETATAVLGKAFGPAGMAAAQAASVLTPMLVGAFRPVGSKLLPSTLQKIKSDLAPLKQETKLVAQPQGIVVDPVAPRGWGVIEPGRLSVSDTLSQQIQGKISNKAIVEYGTEKFPLDPYLGHVKGSPYETPDKILHNLYVEKVSPSSYAERARGFTVLSARTRRLVSEGKREPSYLDEELKNRRADIYAYREALATKEPIFKVSHLDAAIDIRRGASNLADILENSPYSPEQLSKKSLEQLVSIGKKTEAAQLKEASVIKDFTVKRSAQLNQEQGLPKGFIELKTQQDLGAETEFMNNCVGAGGAHPQTGKFIPKWHPITGEQITKGFAEDSGDQYWKRLQSGNERIFSYRPEGLPVATIRMDTRTGEVIEALGVENRPIPASMVKEIKLFTDRKKGEFLGFPLAYKYRQLGPQDAKRWDTPAEIYTLLRPYGEGFVQRAEWNRQGNLRRIQQIQNDFRQVEAGEWEPDGGLFGDF